MRRLPLIIILSSFLISCSATKKSSKAISSYLHNSPDFKQSFTGLAVYDLEQQEMIYTHNANKYFTPASNTKLFTFYTALKVLGDSIPALHFTSRGDSLFFKGTGDPSLLYHEVSSTKVLNFLKSAPKKLVYIAPTYTEKYFGPGWSWDDYKYAYSAERSAFPIFGNLVNFKYKAGYSQPIASPKLFQDSLKRNKQSTHTPNINRNLASNQFYYNTSPKKSNFEKEIPFKYSSQLAMQLLQDTLKKPIYILKKKPKDLELNQTLYSIPADSLYKTMLKNSDNFIAEQLLLLVADKLSDTLKTKIAIKYMEDTFLKDLPDEPVWVDGSGLSRYNLFTPRSMVKLLQKIKIEVPQEKLLHLLPVGGESGTLKNYYKAEKPYIFAKTGSLSNNHSLSGFLKTRSGKVLIFSFMNSNYTIPTKQLKAGMEKVLLKIRDTY